MFGVPNKSVADQALLDAINESFADAVLLVARVLADHPDARW
jgi:hypothetical protein